MGFVGRRVEMTAGCSSPGRLPNHVFKDRYMAKEEVKPEIPENGGFLLLTSKRYLQVKVTCKLLVVLYSLCNHCETQFLHWSIGNINSPCVTSCNES